jgi:hypothetical protein
MNVPDYVSPVVAYRVWHLGPCGLTSLNGEFWHPNQTLEAVCWRSVNRHTPPHGDCSCGIYAAKSLDHLRGIGYAERGVLGEVYLWGTVVEHKLGWRAQFAYPKTLVVRSPEMLLYDRQRLKILIGYGADLFLAGQKGNIPLWTKQCRGFDHVREVVRRMLLRFRTPKSHNSWRQWANYAPAQSRHTFVPMQSGLERFASAEARAARFAAAEAQAKEIYSQIRATAALVRLSHGPETQSWHV